MLKKLLDFLSLFRKGKELANVEIWKDRGNAISLLIPVILALVKVAGDFNLVAVELSTEEASAIAFGIVSLVQFVIGNITSKRAGILPEKPSAEPVQQVERIRAENIKDVPLVSKTDADRSDNSYTGKDYSGGG